MTPLENCARSRAWRVPGILARLAVGIAVAASAGGHADAATLPEIRTSTQNKVPACVTPQRLMSFLKSRNPGVDKRFADIANLYKRHGERWRVRWDYAFYQMAVETNFLSYKQGNGRWGDVDPAQNNFAGLGTTGGGVPGDRYPDVTTGVLAQIQHLVAYSGEHIADPVGARTKLKQDDIIESVAHLKGHVTFNDLSHRWAVDRHYGASIEWVANSYRSTYCKPGAQRAEAERAEAAPEIATAEAAPGPASAPKPPRKVAQLAPAEALGGPKVEDEPAARQSVAEAPAEPAPAAETAPAAEPETVVAAAAPETTPAAETSPAATPETVVAAAAPKAVVVASVEPAAQPTAEEAPEATRVRTIWSRDEEDTAAPQPAEGAAAAPEATPPAAQPAPTAKPKTAKVVPLPIAKATVAAAAPTTANAQTAASADASAAATRPVSIAKAGTAPPVPVAKAEVAPPILHAPEERPVDMATATPAPPATAAIDPAPAPAQAPEAGVRSFAFAPAVNLAELSPAQQQPTKAAAAPATGGCRIMAASYGGKKTLLVRTQAGSVTHYTALTVLEGFEASMFENFVKAHARGGASLGEYETKDAALAKARELCPGSAAAPKAEGASAG